MPTIDERVDALERDMADLKADLGNLPDLIRAGFQQMDRRFDALRADIDRKIDGVNGRMDDLRRELQADIQASSDQVGARIDRVRETLSKEIAGIKPST